MAASTMAASTRSEPGFSFSFVFAECAPSDLIALWDGEAFEHSDALRFFGPSRLEELSPVNLVSAALPPILLFHGGADQVVAIAQSERYAETAASAGVPVEFVRYADGDHSGGASSRVPNSGRRSTSDVIREIRPVSASISNSASVSW